MVIRSLPHTSPPVLYRPQTLVFPDLQHISHDAFCKLRMPLDGDQAPFGIHALILADRRRTQRGHSFRKAIYNVPVHLVYALQGIRSAIRGPAGDTYQSIFLENLFTLLGKLD